MKQVEAAGSDNSRTASNQVAPREGVRLPIASTGAAGHFPAHGVSMQDRITPADSGRSWEITRGDGVKLLKAQPDESIDSIVTDPPYGIALKLQQGPKRPRSIRGDGLLEARRLWERWVPEAYRAAKPDTAHVVFGTWKSQWMVDVLAKHFRVVGCVVWDKKQVGLGWYLRSRWELFYLVHKSKPPMPEHGKAIPDVWQIQRQYRPQHPCQKPEELMRRCVRLVCPAGGVVADPFAGIFSTGVAAVLEGRRFIGADLGARYCKLGRERLERAARDAN